MRPKPFLWIPAFAGMTPAPKLAIPEKAGIHVGIFLRDDKENKSHFELKEV